MVTSQGNLCSPQVWQGLSRLTSLQCRSRRQAGLLALWDGNSCSKPPSRRVWEAPSFTKPEAFAPVCDLHYRVSQNFFLV